ncbi:MAG: glycerol-3-phosphate dehydrogenase [Bacteroidetes bacterium]|nr:glycerol-3-phosphate dehydrogenase [Bacteroidota bacterium]
MRLGVVGSGSWATALAKVLLDNGHAIHWWVRESSIIDSFQRKRHNPRHLTSTWFPIERIEFSTNLDTVLRAVDVVLIAVPAAYLEAALGGSDPASWSGKNVISAVKGLLPGSNLLLNDYLLQHAELPLPDYFALLGPSHAEEVAAEKLSYLTFSGMDTSMAEQIAAHFSNEYINTLVNDDILGVQYAAILKNVYALGAGIANGLDYGDNFLSVLISNAADEMAGFLKKLGAYHIIVGEQESEDPVTHRMMPNYAASVYLGDLLVTCYSLHSRNRRLGGMIGKGYSVQVATGEMNMVAEGLPASNCIHQVNESRVRAEMPIAEAVYRICWGGADPKETFKVLETQLI